MVQGIIKHGIEDAVRNLEKQKKFFLKADIEERFLKHGTINIDISPHSFEVIKPDIEVKDIDWGQGFRETFQFIKLKLIYDDKLHDGYIYIPSKTPHSRDIVEVLTELVPEVEYGKKIELDIPFEKLRIINA